MKCIVPAHVSRLLLLLCIIPEICFGTLILTEWSPSGVIVVADGMAIYGVGAYLTTCKIVRGSRDCFVSVAGVENAKDFNFDLIPIARAACMQRGSIQERAERFKSTALPEIRRVMPLLKAYHGGTWSILMSGGRGQTHTTVIFAGGPKNGPVIAMVDFTISASAEVTPNETTVHSGSFPARPKIDVTGEGGLAGEYIRRHPNEADRTGVAYLRRLMLGAIQIDTEEAPRRDGQRTIGHPISILQFDDSGPRYIEQGACPVLADSQESKSATKKGK